MVRWLSLLLCSVLLTACGDAYPKLKKLGGDYIYWVATDDLIFIIKGDPNGPNSTIIPESIDLIGSEDGRVFGHVTPYPEELAGAKTPESARGYFYLNLSTGSHEIGMTERDWATFLKERGIGSSLERLRSRL
jgi:hypothetical protein